MKIRWTVVLLAFALLVSACGDGGTEAGESGTENPDADGSGSDGSGGEDGSDDVADDDSDDDGSADDASDDESDASDGDQPDNDDFGEIIGDPDFDVDALDENAADMIDSIDDIVSIGDCVATTIGIGLVAPEGWVCRVLDNPVPGFDGFTLFTEGGHLEITVGSPSPIATCDFEGICSNVTPVDIPGFSDAIVFDLLGISGGISGSHDVYEADLVVSNDAPFTDEDIQFVADLMATLAEV